MSRRCVNVYMCFTLFTATVSESFLQVYFFKSQLVLLEVIVQMGLQTFRPPTKAAAQLTQEYLMLIQLEIPGLPLRNNPPNTDLAPLLRTYSISRMP